MKKLLFVLMLLFASFGTLSAEPFQFTEVETDKYYCENIDVYFYVERGDINKALKVGRKYAEGASFNILEKSEIDDFLLGKEEASYYTYYRILDNGMYQFRYVKEWDRENVIVYELLSYK